ncbi:MAG: hypothetical protein PHF46_00765 [Candidatus Gracilibacteria bacterium]|nr:hypothetical protein [Candidatus Gracilibacteria bacterium]MDD3119924.1 hypothetical protein [Candidatus Gracilibacteria bacterium]MDD4530891.1 hypothetical protein [Candidatus Gracilibacteria bacterium]
MGGISWASQSYHPGTFVVANSKQGTEALSINDKRLALITEDILYTQGGSLKITGNKIEIPQQVLNEVNNLLSDTESLEEDENTRLSDCDGKYIALSEDTAEIIGSIISIKA